MNIPAQFWDEYKTRNILSLADRVQVIREYDSYLTKPSYQKLASKYDCSSKQIKNILLSRESILRSYLEASKNKNGRGEDVIQKRQEKIEFLGKVVYEYIQRVLYFGYSIDDEAVRQKALQIKECIAVENFQPTTSWLKNFKATYGIPGFDMETLRNNVPLVEEKRPHLSAIDMIQYVSRLEQQEEKKSKRNESSNNAINRKRKQQDEQEEDQDQNYNYNGQNVLEPTIVYETIDEDYEDDKDVINVVKLPNNSDGQEQYRVKVPDSPPVKKWQASPPERRSPSPAPFPDIESPKEALRHLKALEEYAMLQDNFRAIGLLGQLEDIFKKQRKNK